MSSRPPEPLTMQAWFARLVPDYKTSDAEKVDSASQPVPSQNSAPTEQPTSSSTELPRFNSAMQSISRPAMACEFEILLNERQYQSGVEKAVEALDLIGRVEDLLSVYRPQSQFSKLNQFASKRPVLVDALTLELTELALDAYRWTEGCFDITAGTLSEAWGFSRRLGAKPTEQQIEVALQSVGSQHVLVDELAQTIAFDCEGLKLNPGGIGKGYALDLAANQLTRSGICDFMIHGGLSSIVARGNRQSVDSNWVVALKHPLRTEELLETFPLRNQSLGTSGSGKQFFHFGGQRYSHLIDPRTGWPAQHMLSVTVVCPSCGIADALATGLFIMGVEQATQFCDRNPEIAVLMIHADPKSGAQRIDRRNWHWVE